MKLKTIVFLILIPFVGVSQRNIIPSFKLIPQQRSLWCWTASIQMIDNYHKFYDTTTLIKQCEIVQNYYIPLRDRRSFAIPVEEFNCCRNLCVSNAVDTITDGDLTLRIPRVDDKSIYKTLFGSIGYVSKGKNKILSFSDIKILVSKKSPFIISGLQHTSVESQHAVVCDGYYSGILRLIHINDPWEKCKGCVYYFNYDLLGCQNTACTDIIKKVITIYDIRKSTTPQIISDPQELRGVDCHPLQNESSISLVQKIVGQFQLENDSQFLDEVGLKNISIQNLLNISPIQIKILSKNKMDLQVITQNNSNGDFYENIEKQIFNVRNPSSNKVCSIVVVKKNGCVNFYFESISVCSWMTKLPPQQVQLGNQNITTPNKYTIISTEPYQEAFYEILINAKQYFIPFLDYPELGLKATNAYEKAFVLNILKNKVY